MALRFPSATKQPGALRSLQVPRAEAAPVTSGVWGPALAALLLHALLVAICVARNDADPSALVCGGTNRIGQQPYEAITKAMGPSGEDGQFYYSLARAPWQVHGQDIDHPGYRQLRILYPAVCWLWSGGHPRLLFYAMPALNLLAIAAMAGLGAAVSLFHGRSAWWGLLLPFAVNSGSPLLHNFTDCFSNLTAFGLAAAWLLGARWWSIVLWAAAAAFSREQNLAILAIVAVAAIGTGQRRVAGGIAAVVVAWCVWAGLLWIAYHRCPLLFGGGNFNLPFTGLVYRWTHIGCNGDDHFSRRLAILHFLSVLHLTVLIPVGAYFVYRTQSRVVAVMLLAGVVLAVMGGTGIYLGFNSYMRVFAWIPMGIWLAGLATPGRWPMLLLSPGALWSLSVALGYV
jgi:hypothetical protein